MKTGSKFLASVGAITIIVVAIGAGVIFSGAYDVGAMNKHSQMVSGFLETTMRRSIKHHAQKVTIPPSINLHDPALATKASADYAEMCLTCHGAPGRKPDPWTAGLHPEPPSLTEAIHASQWTDAEVYWIIKHGIKDTGMMAFGPSHQDDDLWALSALVRQLPNITPDQFRAMTDHATAMEKAGHSAHDQDTHSHHD
ncbi:MAG: cytochrome c [Opitutaceae bacterium]